MPPQIPILAQSENKSKFLERLGISDQTEDGKRLYSFMKEEAIAGRARMSANPRSLLPQLIDDPKVKPPYSNTQISEAAMHRETLYIYQIARPETRPIYERGHYTEGGTEENWIIKWLLWHVFRYRDNRNRGRALPAWLERTSQPPEPYPRTQGGNEAFVAHTQLPGPSSMIPGAMLSQSAASPTGGVIQALDAYTITENSDQDTTVQQYRPQGYWDPVRDAQRSNG